MKAIIANIGGNDSVKLLPLLSPDTIIENPKILCGYSDVMTLHLYCYQLGLSTFYGDNLLTTIAEAQMWHPYSKYWFQKVLFDNSIIGNIPPSQDWSFSPNNHTNRNYKKTYIKNEGYVRLQGSGAVRGRLFGGHGGLAEYDEHCGIKLQKSYFENKIFFFEDIPEVCNIAYMSNFFDWLGKKGYLQVLKGVIIGKMRSDISFEPYAEAICNIVSDKYGLTELPIMYGLNFGHTSPICILPYDAEAELDVDKLRFAIIESGTAP